ncbi:hypothetical protein KI387_033397, partial [Taxus chinensis]
MEKAMETWFTAVLAAKCLHTKLKIAEERLISGQNQTVVSTSTSEGESIGGTVSVVSIVLATECLRAKPKNAEE